MQHSGSGGSGGNGGSSRRRCYRQRKSHMREVLEKRLLGGIPSSDCCESFRRFHDVVVTLIWL